MNQKIVFTGGSSGLGKVAFEQMAKEGHDLILLARNKAKAEKDFEAISKKTSIEIIETDLSSFESVLNACKVIKTNHSEIHQLVLNAALWNMSLKETPDGIEEILQVNVLSNILLIDELKDLIQPKGRIIITASALHQGKINFEDLEFRKKYSGFKAYRQSKLGVILMTKYYQEELKEKDIKVVCQHPGVVSTGLGRDAGILAKFFFKTFAKSPEKGSRTLQFLMKINFDQLESGAYYANSKVKTTHAYSRDLENAKRLIITCNDLIKSKTNLS